MADTLVLITALAARPFRAQNEISIWQQIADRIEAACLDGRLGSMDRLPGENHMAEAFGVTRVTIRRALTQLQHKGLLQARKGVGVFVRPVPLKYSVDHGKHFADGIEGGAVIGTRTISLIRNVANGDEAKALSIEIGAPVIRLLRTRLVNDATVYSSDKVFPGRLFQAFETEYALRESVRDVYLAHGVADYRRVETRVSGGFALPQEAEALGLTLHTPVLRSVAINTAADGTPIEFNRGTWPLTAVELVLKNQE
ncbi:phosphonate metabolism transcriptional regulator PhnF [Sulfitobacter undariae]|uniref:Phosphonate metabolism transcriptional regulator PhnF n=1 Tax=Sulfitobacter undariae TaxID=1563671 RepID=A0A7W6EC70_9RHOB|nr:phosphonate metabolism transcriptional regulator PhnF [Sulfitobacter undariae]MBB3995940.1 phosphonate metabolism transcriptional regulator PhnF [Sulfitobacter undariae]